jgi:TonB-linked SusC/RagA family outer membrane protein
MRKLVLMVPGLLFLLTGLLAQKTTVTGKVTDEKGVAIPGATVKVKGTKSGVAANNSGVYSLSVDAGAKLVVSATGFLEKEVTAENNLTITLTEDTRNLSEVVVTALGVKRRPKELGYSVAKVSNEEITNGRSTTIANSLSGKVSGLAVYNVNNSVDPSVKITLRGYRSLTGNNDALLVIDGLPMPEGGNGTILNLINPNDIDNVSVLKGGVAAALYGSAGVNGALIITTKKGVKGKARVSYTHSTNFEKLNQMALFQEKYGSGSHYAAGFGTAAWKPNYIDRMHDNWRSYENQQFGDAFDGTIRVAGRVLQDSSRNMLPYSAIAGERDRIWNTGLTVNNQASVSGGTDQTTFYLSAENNLTWGIVPEDKAQRTGARFGATTETGRLKAGFNLNYVQASYDRTTFDFYNETINQAGNIPLSTYRNWQTNKFANPNGYYNDYFTNPYFRLDNERVRYQDANINGTMDLTYKILPWLNAYNKISLMNNARTQKNSVGQFIHSDYAKKIAYVPGGVDKGDGAGITRAGTDFLGSVSDNINNENIINNEFQLQYNKDFNDLSLRGAFGFSLYDRKTKSVSIGSAAVVVPQIFNVENRLGNLSGGESNTEYRKYGYYGEAQLGWKDYLFLHVFGRYDATSKFFKQTRPANMYSYFYPGVDASAVITDIFPAIKNNILGYAKLRVGYNKNGNDNINPYGLDPVFSNASGFPYGNTVGITVGDVLPDKDLRPEFVYSFEVGGEFQLLRNRINLDLTYYTQKSEGQVVLATIPRTTGYGQLRINVGTTKNWGFETDLKAQIIKTPKFSWDVNVRYAYNNNKIVSLYKDVTEFFQAGFTYAGAFLVNGQSFPQMKAISYVRDSVGRIVVNKATGYPLNNGPLKNFGRVTPPHILGLGTRVRYDDIQLSVNFEYRGGNVMYSDLGRQMSFTGSGKWTEQRAPFIVPNSSYIDATGKYVPNDKAVNEAEYDYWVTYYRVIAENFVVPAWFIKLRDINLSYSLPDKLVSKMKVLSNVSVGLYGRNLLTIVDKKNQFTDPEFSFTAGNGLGVSTTTQSPPVKQYGVTLSVNFK